MPPSTILRWKFVELVHLRSNITQHERELARYSPDERTNKRYKKRILDGERDEERNLLEETARFADQHSLSMDNDVLNLGRQGQLVLF